MLLKLFLLVMFALKFDKTLIFVTLTGTYLRHHLNLMLSNSTRFSRKNRYYVIRVLLRFKLRKKSVEFAENSYQSFLSNITS